MKQLMGLDLRNWRREAIAGVTTFFTMSYIVIVNPAILSSSGTGMPFSGVLTATVLVCFSMTLLMGLYAKLPFAVAPGMGVNAFFAFSLVIGRQIPWPVALGMVVWAGVLFVLISVTPLRAHIAQAIPKNLRLGAAAGIGVFLTFIGLKNIGFIAPDPVTLVRLGKVDGRTLLALLGLGVMALLVRKKNPFAFLAGIGLVTLVAGTLGWLDRPETLVGFPDFSSVFLKADLIGSLQLAFLPAILAVMFTDLFDSISTFVGVSHATGLVDKNGEPLRLKEGLVVDAFATLGAGLAGSSSGTAYIESAAGIEAGGRTGLTSVFTALCFLPCFFLAPLAGMIPEYATAPVLILVGACMFRTVAHLKLEKIEDLLPPFLTILLIPLTFSITQGILWGLVSHAFLFVCTGRRREISPALAVLSVVCLTLLIVESGHWGQ